jgi:phage-related protein
MPDNFVLRKLDSLEAVNTSTYKIHVFDMNAEDAPEIETDEVVIPGRNGSEFLLSARMPNIVHRYMCVIYENAYENYKNFRQAIAKLSIVTNGNTQYAPYMRLSDSFRPDEYYMARYLGGLTPKMTPDKDMVKFVIEFTRKPQRYLVEGETRITMRSNYETVQASIINPTGMPARPLITVKGDPDSYFYIGGAKITIVDTLSGTFSIDSEDMECYQFSTTTKKVALQDYKFPILTAGSNTAQMVSSGIQEIAITPRWWRL